MSERKETVIRYTSRPIGFSEEANFTIPAGTKVTILDSRVTNVCVSGVYVLVEFYLKDVRFECEIDSSFLS